MQVRDGRGAFFLAAKSAKTVLAHTRIQGPHTRDARRFATCQRIFGACGRLIAFDAADGIGRERHLHQFGKIACAHFRHDVGAVHFSRARADAQIMRDDLV